MRKRGSIRRLGALGALILSLVLLPPLLGVTTVARAEVSVTKGDYSAYALDSSRENRVLSFTIGGLNKGATLSGLVVVPVTGSVGQALTAKDYTYDDRTNELVITNANGFLGKLGVGQYRLTILFDPAGQTTGNFYVFEKDTIQYIAQPSTVVTNIGDDVTFECRATATATFTYQWQRLSRTGWKNIRGATTRVMTITTVPEALQGYTFRCVVATSFASAASDEAKLYMIGAGDGAPLWLYGLGAVVAAAGLAGCLLWRRRRRSSI